MKKASGRTFHRDVRVRVVKDVVNVVKSEK